MAVATRNRKASSKGRKAGAKRTAKPAATNGSAPTKREQGRDAALKAAPEIKKLRDTDHLSWAEIADKMGMDGAKVIVLYDIANVTPKNRIKDLTAELVVELRDEQGLSWSQIAGRATAGGEYTTIAQVKKIYASTGKKAAGRKGRVASASKPKARRTARKTKVAADPQ